MPFTPKDPNGEKARVRSVYVTDRIYELIRKDHGTLADYIRKYEQIDNKLKKLGK